MSAPPESQKALLTKLLSHRPRVPKAERPEFDRALGEVEDIALRMNAAVDRLMSHVASRVSGKHFGDEVTGTPAECSHAAHPPWLCQRQKPTCGEPECWCAAEFTSGRQEATH